MNTAIAPLLVAERHGLTPVRAGVLLVLHAYGRPVLFGELRRELRVTVKSQLVRAHQTLGEQGLVERHVCAADRTLCEFTLTAAGRRIAREIEEASLYGTA